MENIDRMLESEDASWRDVLSEVLKGLDPWDVDIVELASRYKIRVDQMERMNFRIPGNVILVCAVLLRMKADILAPADDGFVDISQALDFIFNSDYPVSALFDDAEPYPIMIKPSRTITRKVTAAELIEAIQDALDEKTKRVERLSFQRAKRAMAHADKAVHEDVVLEPQINILDFIEKTYGIMMEILSKKDVVMMSDMAKTKDEVLNCFLSLLHLSNSQRVTLSQEVLFGEIYIKPA